MPLSILILNLFRNFSFKAGYLESACSKLSNRLMCKFFPFSKKQNKFSSVLPHCPYTAQCFKQTFSAQQYRTRFSICRIYTNTAKRSVLSVQLFEKAILPQGILTVKSV